MITSIVIATFAGLVLLLNRMYEIGKREGIVQGFRAGVTMIAESVTDKELGGNVCPKK